MLDVDSKDPAVGMSCPPQPFVEREFLETIKSLLHTGGIFIMLDKSETKKIKSGKILVCPALPEMLFQSLLVRALDMTKVLMIILVIFSSSLKRSFVAVQ